MRGAGVFRCTQNYRFPNKVVKKKKKKRQSSCKLSKVMDSVVFKRNFPEDI